MTDAYLRDLDGHVVIVTGGGRGLGRAIALALAARGAALSLVGRSPEVLKSVAEMIESRGSQALATQGDVSEPASVSEVVARTVERFGTVDVLVNNAAMQFERSALETTPDELSVVLRTNLAGPFLYSQAVASVMRDNGGGSIINIASVFALKGISRYSAYSASKGGLLSLTRTLAVEWARYGIRVNAIAAGHFATSANEDDLADPELRERILQGIPVRRVANPEELGPLVCYLASHESKFMTGTTITIDGGLSIV